MEHDRDILQELTADHDDIRVLFSRMIGLRIGDPRRKALVDEVTGELVRHAIAEESCLYPLVRQLPDGEVVAGQELRDHAVVETLLRHLQWRTATTAGFDRLVAQLVELVTGHLGHEEARIFPALRAVIPGSELRRLGEQVREVKRHARTSPRPGASATIPPDNLLPPERGPVARLHDLLVSHRGTR
ncbi:hemerythrin domain-containing protein [Kitasatospora sp. NPDC052896]|uniref:hemerythrin domain-containing protein n=1 Tax=Kitasatospora sp. NPDC052896 TaxID=3364061 RepID=UPI0037CB5293